MICKRRWLALGLMAAMVGCEPGGGPSTPAPASSKGVPSSGTSGAQAVPATDASKEPAAATGGLSPTGTDAAESQGAGSAQAKAAGAVTFSEKELAGIRKLPADEQAAALAQKVCPISGDHLGSMGKPQKVTADGKTAYLCCDGCEEDFRKDPKAALAKIGK